MGAVECILTLQKVLDFVKYSKAIDKRYLHYDPYYENYRSHMILSSWAWDKNMTEQQKRAVE